MEPLIETIVLDMEEANELAFKVKVEGASSPAKVRLVCEGNDVAYMFSGRPFGNDDVVEFTIPQMKDKLQEGTYTARVEVLIENRYFTPVQFQINFKKTLKVFAEAIKVQKPVLNPEVKVSAAPVMIQKVVPPSPPLAVVQPQQQQIFVRKVQQPAIEKKIQESSGPTHDADSLRSMVRDILFGPKGSK